MVNVGLVVLSGSKLTIKQKLPGLLRSIIPQVQNKLYVKLEVPQYADLLELVPIVYRDASVFNDNNVDLRVLLNRRRRISIDHVFEEQQENIYIPKPNNFWQDSAVSFKHPYDSVVLGGTFDRLHNGHKVLLSVAVLHTNKILTCGVTQGDMNKKKTLCELIEPVKSRCEAVNEFLMDVSDGLEYRILPIIDPFGPSIVDPDMRCIVVSEETLKGGHMVNEKRMGCGLCKLDIHIVKLVEDIDHVLNETKVSSSTRRRKLLGTILREPKKQLIFKSHYVIGLNGGIAAGKTHISKYLKEHGCDVIDCDKVVHQLYAENIALRDNLKSAFGDTVINSDGSINRRALGAIVFGNNDELKKLNAIVWPAVAEEVGKRIESSSKKIVVVDAAELLEAGWEKFLDQIWTTFVPRDEAIRRVCERDNLTEEEAGKRVDSQMSNIERISRSNVVFYSLWDYSETEAQIQRALDIVNEKYIK